MKAISIESFKEKNKEMNTYRNEAACELFKSITDLAINAYDGNPVKVMEFKMPFGTVQLNFIGDFGTMKTFTLVDVNDKHGYPKELIDGDYESFYLEILRELNYIRTIHYGTQE